jgi:hypothetical protein
MNAFVVACCVSLILIASIPVHAQQEKPNPNRVEDVKTDLHYIDTGFENASPLWYEVEEANLIKIHLPYDHERDAPNRANLHFHFKLHANPGSKLTLEFDQLDNVWNRMKSRVSGELKLAVVSVDGKTWEPIRVEQLKEENKSRLVVEMPGPVLSVCRVEPYLFSHLDQMLDKIRQHPDTDIRVIGKTVEGRPLEIVRIGRESAPYRVFLRARAHPWESGGNWVLQGLVDKLLSDDDAAKKALSNYCVYMLPMANKDGVARGRSRFNLRGRDLNRNWDQPSDPELAPENFALEEWLKVQIAAGQKPHLALELHNDGNGRLHINRPMSEEGERHYDRMKIFEELLRAHTWFREGTSISPGGGGTLGAGWLTRYGIDGAVHEFNCNWLEGAQDFPSAKRWKEYGSNLVTVFDQYFTTVKP